MKIRRYLDKDKEKIKKFVASNLMDIFNTDTIAGAEDLEDIKKKFEQKSQNTQKDPKLIQS